MHNTEVVDDGKKAATDRILSNKQGRISLSEPNSQGSEVRRWRIHPRARIELCRLGNSCLFSRQGSHMNRGPVFPMTYSLSPPKNTDITKSPSFSSHTLTPSLYIGSIHSIYFFPTFLDCPSSKKLRVIATAPLLLSAQQPCKVGKIEIEEGEINNAA